MTRILFILAALLFVAAFAIVGFNPTVGYYMYIAALGSAILGGLIYYYHYRHESN